MAWTRTEGAGVDKPPEAIVTGAHVRGRVIRAGKNDLQSAAE